MSTATPATNVRPARDVSTMSGTMLVAKREIITTVRTPAFIWSFVITLVVVALLILGQRFIGDFFVSAMGDGANTVATAKTPPSLKPLGLRRRRRLPRPKHSISFATALCVPPG